MNDDGQLPFGAAAWGSTRILLPAFVRAARYRHVITGEWCETLGSDHADLPVAAAFRHCPSALLWAAAGEAGVLREDVTRGTRPLQPV